MTESGKHPPLARLQQFASLGELADLQLAALANALDIHSAAPGEVLIKLGSTSDAGFYLLSGQLQLTAADGRVTTMRHTEPSARHQVAHLRPSHYQVKALDRVEYLHVEPELIERIQAENPLPTTAFGFEVNLEEELDSSPVENQLIFRLYEDLNADSLTLPSLPDVALKIGKAISADSTDANRLANLLSNDPAIAAKLLKVANSARYGGLAPTRTLPQAISRLGFRDVHNLVIAFALKEVFSSKSPNLLRHMTDLWEHSRRVAAMAHALARRLSGFDPDFALLAGLLHDIGTLVVINYASDYPETAENPTHLQEAIAHLRGQLGKMVILKWHLPEELGNVAEEAENWSRSTIGKPDYVDLIIIAQAHCHISRNQMDKIPPLEQIPAFSRLGFEPTAEHSLRLLKEAAKEIKQTEELLGR